MPKIKLDRMALLPLVSNLLSPIDAFVVPKPSNARNQIIINSALKSPETKKTAIGWDLTTTASYVPDGLTEEEYRILKENEEEKLKSMNFAHFGPRFQKSDKSPMFDWMLLPDLWTSGKVIDHSVADSTSLHSMPNEEQVLLLLEHYATTTSQANGNKNSSENGTTGQPLRILAPVVQPDLFAQKAWKNGHHVTMLGLVPSAAMAMRSWFGVGAPTEWIEHQLPATISDQKPKEDEDERNRQSEQSVVVWQHKSGRANIIVGYGLETDEGELAQEMLQPAVLGIVAAEEDSDGNVGSSSNLFDVVYDHTAIEALDPPSRRQVFRDKLVDCLKEDGYLYTETDSRRIGVQKNGTDDRRNRMIATSIPVPEDSEDDNEDGVLSLNLESHQGESVVKHASSMIVQTPVVSLALMDGARIHNINGIDLVGHDADQVRHVVHNAVKEKELTVLSEIPQAMFDATPRDKYATTETREQEDKEENKNSSTILVEIEKNSVGQKIGVRFNREEDGTFTIRHIASDSPFRDTSLKVGMEIIAINGIQITGRYMAFCGELLSTCLHVTLEAVGGDEEVESEGMMPDQRVEDEQESEDSSPISLLLEEKKLSEIDTDSVIFGSNFECIASLGSIEINSDSTPALADVGHLLRVVKT